MTPAGFIDLERSLPSNPMITELHCVRVSDVHDISPDSTISADMARVRVVFGSQSEHWLVTGSVAQVKTRLAQAQRLLELGTVASEITELELRALGLLAEMQQVSPAQILRQALDQYCRSVLTWDEYRTFYPL
jgi:hypothetical protein